MECTADYVLDVPGCIFGDGDGALFVVAEKRREEKGKGVGIGVWVEMWEGRGAQTIDK